MASKQNIQAREEALQRHVENLSPNLLRAYLLDLLTDARPEFTDMMVNALHANNNVPAKEA